MPEQNELKGKRLNGSQVVIFSLDQEEYAVPIEIVQEVVKITEITPIPNSPAFIAGVVNLRGKIISIVDLERRFQLEHQTEKHKSEHIIVIDQPASPFGIIVDKVTEVLRLAPGSIQEAPQTGKNKIGSQFIKGIIILTEKDEQIDVEQPESDEPDQAAMVKESEQPPEVPAKVTTKTESESETKESSQRIILVLDLKNLLTKQEQQSLKTSADKTPIKKGKVAKVIAVDPQAKQKTVKVKEGQSAESSETSEASG